MITSEYYTMNKSSKIFIDGHRGMVGSSILRALQARGYNNFVLKNSAELDLRNQLGVANFFAIEKPEFFFGCSQSRRYCC